MKIKILRTVNRYTKEENAQISDWLFDNFQNGIHLTLNIFVLIYIL